MMLKGMRLHVDSAEDGAVCVSRIEAALQQAGDGQPPPYDVIFMDDHMPNLTGVEATARLRELGLAIPIFGVTGNALLSDQARFMAAGVTKVYTKPVTKASIATAVHMAQEARKARLAAPP